MQPPGRRYGGESLDRVKMMLSDIAGSQDGFTVARTITETEARSAVGLLQEVASDPLGAPTIFSTSLGPDVTLIPSDGEYLSPVDPAPKIKRSIRICVRDYVTGVIRLLARLIVSPDGGIVLSTPWGRRSGLFLSELRLIQGQGIRPVAETTFKVGVSGVVKCHYHRSGFTSVQSEEGGKRLSVQLPALEDMHMQQLAYLYAASIPGLPQANNIRARDVLIVEDRPGIGSLSLHVVAYDRRKYPASALGRVRQDSPITFASNDGNLVLVDVSATGLNFILGLHIRTLEFAIENQPEYSMNMFHFSDGNFDGAVGVQTQSNMAGLGMLGEVPDLLKMHDVNLLQPFETRYRKN
jgi:hypothetical protein